MSPCGICSWQVSSVSRHSHSRCGRARWRSSKRVYRLIPREKTFVLSW